MYKNSRMLFKYIFLQNVDQIITNILKHAYLLI